MNDRERWDAKHRAAESSPNSACDAFVLEGLRELDLVEGARALDLASGSGRHGIELAKRGFQVEAWDVSPVGLELLADRARSAGVPVATRANDLKNDFPQDLEPFDLVVLVNYLDRRLFERLHQLVRPRGWLIYTTFTKDHGGTRPGPRHCLDVGELKRGIPGFRSVQHLEQDGRAGLLARRDDPS